MDIVVKGVMKHPHPSPLPSRERGLLGGGYLIIPLLEGEE